MECALSILIMCSINHIPDDRNDPESLPQGVENMSNYVEISSWYVQHVTLSVLQSDTLKI